MTHIVLTLSGVMVCPVSAEGCKTGAVEAAIAWMVEIKFANLYVCSKAVAIPLPCNHCRTS